MVSILRKATKTPGSIDLPSLLNFEHGQQILILFPCHQKASTGFLQILHHELPMEFLPMVLLGRRILWFLPIPYIWPPSMETDVWFVFIFVLFLLWHIVLNYGCCLCPQIFLRLQHDLRRRWDDLFTSCKPFTPSWSDFIVGDNVAFDKQTERRLVSCRYSTRKYEEFARLQSLFRISFSFLIKMLEFSSCY